MFNEYNQARYSGRSENTNIDHLRESENTYIEEHKDSEGNYTPEVKYMLSKEGRIKTRAEAYASGEITLEEFYSLEALDSFTMTKEEFNKLPLNEQNNLFRKFPEKVRAILEGGK